MFSQIVDFGVFPSTLPLREATTGVERQSWPQGYFYPHSPHGERPTRATATSGAEPIPIRALRKEGDLHWVRLRLPRYRISIHALRKEGDLLLSNDMSRHGDFYPRPPQGGRLPFLPSITLRFIFLSTPSARRATADRWYIIHAIPISIHALRKEGDKVIEFLLAIKTVFLSTPSARRATRVVRVVAGM